MRFRWIDFQTNREHEVDMQTQRITVKGHSGDVLAARLDLPDGPVRATAIFAHCFTCSKDLPATRHIAARFAAQGVAVLRFDFTGLGHSHGEVTNTRFSSNVEDLLLAVTGTSMCRFMRSAKEMP